MSGWSRVASGKGDGAAGIAPETAQSDVVGTIELVAGVATVTRADGDLFVLKIGSPVFQGDIVETAANGHVTIRFIDGTAFSLSKNARVALQEFSSDEALPSALLDVERGTFAFIAGQVAKAGRLRIETPVASIRGRVQSGGIGILSLTALYFAALEKAEAISSSLSADDGAIDCKDMGEYGVVELVPHGRSQPQFLTACEVVHIFANGSSDVSQLSPAQLVQLQAQQQDTLQIFRLGLQVPTLTGPGGSSSSPSFELPSLVKPINFVVPDNTAPQDAASNTGAGPNKATISDTFIQIPPPPPPPPPGPATPGPVTELADVTGDADFSHDTSGTLAFSSVSFGDPSFVWSGGGLPAAQQGSLPSASMLSLAPGSADFMFSISDAALDFLAAGETLTVTYNVTETDDAGNTFTQQIVITATGTEDNPQITTATSNALVELAGTNNESTHTVSGTISFADVDLTDRPTVTAPFASYSYLAADGTTALILTAAQQSAVETALAINPNAGNANNGSAGWTYSVPDNVLDFLAKNETLTLTYMATVDDGHGGVVTTPITVTIHGTNDAPAVTAQPASVSEEGLPGGVPDAVGNPSDTSNSKTFSGTVTASDVDGDSLTFKLGNPPSGLMSGGQSVTWTGGGTDTLVGKVGSTTVLTVTIDNTGDYTVTLSAPVDHSDPASEDVKTIYVPVNVNDGTTTTSTLLPISIEDDSPVASPSTNDAYEASGINTNIMLIIDVSGSMNFASGIAGLTRLDLVKASVSELLEQYDNLGDVKVRIVTFSNGGSQQGGAWVDVEQAKTIVNGLTAGGSTNYDAALTTAQTAFASNGKNSDGQNVSYFLSDGDPSTSPTGPHQSAWLSFVNSNDIDSFAIGVGNGVSVTSLNPIAFDGRGAGTNTNGIVVTDPEQLIGTLIGTLVQPVNSNVLLNGTPENQFGADGGYVRSIGFDERTYTYDKATNTISDDNGGPLDNASFNFSSHVLTIVSAISGTLAIDMDSAAYTFTAPGSNSNVPSVVYGYTLIDGDGDTASNTLTITLHNTELPPIVRDDNVITNISGGFGTNIAIPDIALLYNDTDAAGQAISVTGVSNAVSGAVVHSAGNVVFTDNNTSGGTFMYTGATDPSSLDTGAVTINRTQAGQSQLDGTGLGDILVGRDNAPDTLLGNAGDDVLIGGNNTNNSIVSFTLTADGSNLSSNNGFLQFHFIDGTAGVDFVQNVTINLRGGSDGNAIFDGEAGLPRNEDGEWGPTATSLTGLASGNISLPSADNTGTMSVNFTNGSFGVGDGFNLAIDVDNLGSNSDGGQFAAQGVTATITLQNGRTQTATFTAVDGDTSVATFKVATDDVLNGGAGNDLLIGGSGADVFQFSANFGHDVVLDFHPGEDLIEIDHTVFADFSALMAHTATVGTDTVITADANNSITLHDVGVATLHPSSFVFT